MHWRLWVDIGEGIDHAVLVYGSGGDFLAEDGVEDSRFGGLVGAERVASWAEQVAH